MDLDLIATPTLLLAYFFILFHEERDRERVREKREMGRYMKKCRGIGKLAVMEVSQVVGVRTRAMTTALATAAKVAKRRKAGSSPAECRIAYLQLRSRRLVMVTPRISRSGVKSSGFGSPCCLAPDAGETSSCESNASCEAAALCSGDRHEVGEDSETAARYPSFGREMVESFDLESTAGRRSPPRSLTAMRPSDAEIEEFFAAAEKKEYQRFARTYNFDIANDVPLEGRYEWVRLSP